VEIGDVTLFSPVVQIYTATHPLNADLRRRQEFAKPIQIGAEVWVGGAAILCPGVTIGSKSVLGAGSVVRRDILSHLSALEAKHCRFAHRSMQIVNGVTGGFERPLCLCDHLPHSLDQVFRFRLS
jgi:hypothetical protein